MEFSDLTKIDFFLVCGRCFACLRAEKVNWTSSIILFCFVYFCSQVLDTSEMHLLIGEFTVCPKKLVN